MQNAENGNVVEYCRRRVLASATATERKCFHQTAGADAFPLHAAMPSERRVYIMTTPNRTLTFLAHPLRLGALDALVLGAPVAGAVNGNPRVWIARQLHDFIFTRHFAAKFV